MKKNKINAIIHNDFIKIKINDNIKTVQKYNYDFVKDIITNDYFMDVLKYLRKVLKSKDTRKIIISTAKKRIQNNKNINKKVKILQEIYIKAGVKRKNARDRMLRDMINYVQAKSRKDKEKIYNDYIVNKLQECISTCCDNVKMINRSFENTPISIKDNVLYYNNKKLSNYDKLLKHMIKLLNNNINVQHYIKFLESLIKNPKTDMRKELFDFLLKFNYPINEDGSFSAYKLVTDRLKDLHTNTILYNIDTVVKMDRKKCDENRNNTCSFGLHFCGYSYLKDIGFLKEKNRVLLEVRIMPEDVVAIPKDYNCSKGRCCKIRPYRILNIEDGDILKYDYNDDIE